MVVQVSLRFEDLPTPFQDGRRHLLGCGLSGAASHRHERFAPSLADPLPQLLKSCNRIGNRKQRPPPGIGTRVGATFSHHRPRGSTREGLSKELMAVET